MSKKTKITRSELLKKLTTEVNGGTFINITTETKPKLTGGKKNEQQGRVSKITTSNVMIFQNKTSSAYGKMVERRLIEEGKDSNFELKPRTWGERIKHTPLITHTKNGEDKLYLEVIHLKVKDTKYFLDGEQVDKEQIVGLPKQSTTGQGGLENKVIIRTPEVNNIREISINKDKFEVIK